MNPSQRSLEQVLKNLRDEFDSSFSRPMELVPAGLPSLALCCQSAGKRFALSISDIGGIFPLDTLVPVPARAQAFLGVGTFRSRIIPVYDLNECVGVEQRASGRGWGILIGKNDPSFAVKVETIDGYASFEVAPVETTSVNDQTYLNGVIRHGSEFYALLDGKRLQHDVIQRTD
jgi:chemotaxis signal transduction protein